LGAPDESPAASIDAQRPSQHPGTLLVRIAGRVDRVDAARFGEWLSHELLTTHSSVVVCDVGGLIRPDAAAVDAICRIRVTAQRLGARLRLWQASAELFELLDLIGLCDVVADPPGSGLQA